MESNERSQTILLLVGLVVVAVVLSLAVLGGSSGPDGPGGPGDRQAAGAFFNKICVHSSGRRVTAEFTRRDGSLLKSFQTIGPDGFPASVCEFADPEESSVVANIDDAYGGDASVVLEGTSTENSRSGWVRVVDPNGRCTGDTQRQEITLGQTLRMTCFSLNYSFGLEPNEFTTLRLLRIDVS